MKLTTHPYLMPRLRISGAMPLLLRYDFMAWTGTTLPLPFSRMRAVSRLSQVILFEVNTNNFEASHYVVSPFSCYFLLSPHILFAKMFHLFASLRVRDQVSNPYKTISKVRVLFSVNQSLGDGKVENCEPNGINHPLNVT